MPVSSQINNSSVKKESDHQHPSTFSNFTNTTQELSPGQILVWIYISRTKSLEEKKKKKYQSIIINFIIKSRFKVACILANFHGIIAILRCK